MINPLQGTFRANPDYEMVLFDRLPEEQRTMLADLEKDPGFYGILRPRPGISLGTKSVCRDTALLFATLAMQPGPIPRYVLRESGAEARRTIVELVLDGVLAMESAGAWLSGASAMGLFGPSSTSTAPDPRQRLARLSWDALEYAASLTITDAALLSGRLYNFNSLPVSAARLASLITSAEFERLHPPAPGEWAAMPSTPESEAWSAWRSRRLDSRPRGHSFKLYVSPLPEALPEAFQAAVAAAGDWGALQFKTGRRGHDLLRPDKLVVYFDQRPSLEGAAAQIRRALSGCPVHGVPFTAPVDEPDGLLSWGFDPPPDPAAPEWLRRESWRLKLSNRLGTALAHAKTNPADGVSPVDFALERIRLEGVDTQTWSPIEEVRP